MKVAVDLDGTADTDSPTYKNLMDSLRASGHKVTVLTGSSGSGRGHDKKAKAAKLASLGLGESYDELKVVKRPPEKPKARYCKKHHIAILIDNSIANAKLASKYCLVLVPWNTIAP